MLKIIQSIIRGTQDLFNLNLYMTDDGSSTPKCVVWFWYNMVVLTDHLLFQLPSGTQWYELH